MRLTELSDRQLLRLRICDLPEIKSGKFDARIKAHEARLHAELVQAGLLHFRPTIYVGDEWFSPDGVPKIAVPFYLAHPRLTALERRMMDLVEGGTPTYFRKLLRHEAGHCFDHAYAVSRRRDWRQIFGLAAKRYNPDVYLPDPESRDFVRHLDDHYAQSHPDEDFAETFAVVITPDLDWRRRYWNWPGALRKLEYVAHLIKTLGPMPPRIDDGPECFAAARMRMTLHRYYERRRSEQAAHRAAVKKLARRAGLSAPPYIH